MLFRGRILHGYPAGLLLLLLLRIVRGQIGRDPFPGLSMIAGTEQKLRSNVDCFFFIWRQSDWRFPVKPKFFLVVWPRLDIARFVRAPIYSRDLAALIFGVNVIRIGGVWKHPETVAVVHVFPLVVCDAASGPRVAH